MTSKQRAKLRSAASNIEPVFQIGKDEISDNQVAGIKDALEARELIKINVLRSCGVTAKEAADELSSRTGAETVAVTGNKIVLYKRSERENAKHIEF